MNKSGLVGEVSKRTGINRSDVARAVDAAMSVIREAVARGERVALAGFGTFERRRRNKRVARNPRRPEVAIPVPARDVPSFTPGQAFRDATAARSGTRTRSARREPPGGKAKRSRST